MQWEGIKTNARELSMLDIAHHTGIVRNEWINEFAETMLSMWRPYPSSVSLMMSQISMLSAQSSDCREPLVACSVDRLDQSYSDR